MNKQLHYFGIVYFKKNSSEERIILLFCLWNWTLFVNLPTSDHRVVRRTWQFTSPTVFTHYTGAADVRSVTDKMYFSFGSCLSVWLIEWLTVWLTEWLFDWLIDWLTCCLSVWMTESLTLTDSVWLSDYLSDSVWLTDWLTGWFGQS
jgi:hypothetical protein